MLGGIAGDVIGSVYEHKRVKSVDFPLFPARARFTDDTVMTMATATVLLDGGDYTEVYREFGYRYPNRGYGATFHRWLRLSDMGPYQSYGNGAAMRAGPIGLARDTIDQVLEEAERSASVSHDHPEGIKGAQAAALGVFLARAKVAKEDIRSELSSRFAYDLSRSVEQIRP